MLHSFLVFDSTKYFVLMKIRKYGLVFLEPQQSLETRVFLETEICKEDVWTPYLQLEVLAPDHSNVVNM